MQSARLHETRDPDRGEGRYRWPPRSTNRTVPAALQRRHRARRSLADLRLVIDEKPVDTREHGTVRRRDEERGAAPNLWRVSRADAPR